MCEIVERIERLHEYGDGVAIAGFYLAFEMAELGRAGLARELGNLMVSERVPGHMEFEDLDVDLIRILTRHVSARESLCWGRLLWQILNLGDRELLSRVESLMRARLAN